MILTKGIIEEVVSPYKAKVRLPVYHGIKTDNYSVKTKDLPEATLCAMPNCDYALNAGDIVYCSIEDNDFSKPVILGFLYKQDKAQTAVDMSVNSLGVVTNTSLPEDTAIGKVGSESIQNLLGIDGNIQRTLSNMNSDLSGRISNTDKSISNIRSSINAIRGDYVDKSTDQLIGGQKDFEVVPRVKTEHKVLIPEELRDTYQQVEYIESTGTQYINAGVQLNQDSAVEIDYQLTQSVQSRTGLFGALNTSRFGILLSPTNHYLEIGYGLAHTNYTPYVQIESLPDTFRHIVKLDKDEAYFDGVLLDKDFIYEDFIVSANTYVGNFNYSNYSPALAKYYGVKIWDNGVLIRHFVPCYEISNNKPGMFDIVSESFYINAGTGEFSVGKNIYPVMYDNLLTDASFSAYLQQIPGYNPSSVQILKHGVGGFPQWVSE